MCCGMKVKVGEIEALACPVEIWYEVDSLESGTVVAGHTEVIAVEMDRVRQSQLLIGFG